MRSNEGDSPNTGLKDAERIKVYVGWAKHALRYTTQTNGGKSLVDILGDNEYRSEEMYYDPAFNTQASCMSLMLSDNYGAYWCSFQTIISNIPTLERL